MPKAAPRNSGASSARTAPYSKDKVDHCAGCDKPLPPITPLAEQDASTVNASILPPANGAKGDKNAKSTESPAEASATPAENESGDGPKNFLELKLPGEDVFDEEGHDTVPIYDTCQIIRKKINDLFGKDNKDPSNAQPGAFTKAGAPKPWTKKDFCEAIGHVNSNSLNRFLKATGRMGGCETNVYRGAYKFFEKKRIWDKKPKSATRKKAEEEDPNGLVVSQDPNRKVWMTVPTASGSIVRKKFRAGSARAQAQKQWHAFDVARGY